MKDELIKVIAEYLESETIHIWHSAGEKMAFLKPTEYPEFSEQKFCQEIAAEIAEKVLAVVMQTGWEDAPEWARYRTVDKDRNVTFWEKQPLVVSSRGFWRQGNDGGLWEVVRYDEDWQNSLEERPK